MTPERDHSELRDLLGVYAIDATEPDEAAAVEAHLIDCEACRDALRDLRRVAGLLGTADTEPPPAIWEAITSELAGRVPVPLRRPPAPRVALTRRWALVAAAAVIVLVAGLAALGVVAVHQQHQLDRANRALASGGVNRTLEAAALAASTTPGARNVALLDSHGNPVATVILVPGSTAYLVPTSMRSLAAGHTYQIWGEHGAALISLAVLGPTPAVTPLAVPGGVTALAVTEEQSPGAVSPTASPIAHAALT